MKIKCKRCKNEWDYNGNKIKLMKKYPQYVSCSKCNTSVKLERRNMVQDEEKGGEKKNG